MERTLKIRDLRPGESGDWVRVTTQFSPQGVQSIFDSIKEAHPGVMMITLDMEISARILRPVQIVVEAPPVDRVHTRENLLKMRLEDLEKPNGRAMLNMAQARKWANLHVVTIRDVIEAATSAMTTPARSAITVDFLFRIDQCLEHVGWPPDTVTKIILPGFGEDLEVKQPKPLTNDDCTPCPAAFGCGSRVKPNSKTCLERRESKAATGRGRLPKGGVRHG